jgi:hypothetical protein
MPDVNEMRRSLLLASAAAAPSFVVGPPAAFAAQPKGVNHMSSSTITLKDGTQIYYKDWSYSNTIASVIA